MYKVITMGAVYGSRDEIRGYIGHLHSTHYTKKWALVIAGRVCGEFYGEGYHVEVRDANGKRVFADRPVEYTCIDNPEKIPF